MALVAVLVEVVSIEIEYAVTTVKHILNLVFEQGIMYHDNVRVMNTLKDIQIIKSHNHHPPANHPSVANYTG